jgi:hypothetical protein
VDVVNREDIMYWDMDSESYDPIVGCWMSDEDISLFSAILEEGLYGLIGMCTLAIAYPNG